MAQVGAARVGWASAQQVGDVADRRLWKRRCLAREAVPGAAHARD